MGRLELRTVGELLLHRPRRYEDRRHFQRIAELQLNQPALACGKIIAAGLRRFRGGRQSVFEMIIDDGSGRLHCRWWNLPFMEKYFKTGEEVVVYGKPVSLRPRTIDHAETEIIQRLESSIHLNRIAPIYPLTEGLSQRWLRSLIWRALRGIRAGHRRTAAGAGCGRAKDARGGRPGCRRHRAPTPCGCSISRRNEADAEIARHRLALDEYIEMQTAIQARRRNLESHARALPCAGDNRLIKPFLAALGFNLTAAQTGVLREIRRDMAGPRPMRRLLQGDVAPAKRSWPRAPR